jgi:predicted alpha/beta-fold hydrolase
LNEVYAAVAARRPVPVPVERVLRARAIREWDGLVVAPRFGFTSAEDYYARASVAPRLDRLRPPALLIWSRGDPMVPWATVEPALAALPGGAQVVVSRRGGHVGFPAGVDFGLGGPRGLAAQVAAWIGGAVAGV